MRFKTPTSPLSREQEPIRLPALSEFETFVLAIEEGSIARAASRLRISPPAAAKRIRQLEAFAQTQLLTRGRRGVEATETGTRLFPIARRLLAQRDRAVQLLAEHASVQLDLADSSADQCQ
jgi:DNA-binding transcriptional LysR family regulator